MYISLITINGNGSDIGLFLNGKSIFIADSQCIDSIKDVLSVADNLSSALGIEITSIDHQMAGNWNWDQVVKQLVEANELVKHDPDNMTTLLETTITDYRVNSNNQQEMLSLQASNPYTCNVEKHPITNHVHFSLYNDALDPCDPETTLHGLHGIISIIDGFPAISLGITPDENIISLYSDTSSQLAIVPNKDNNFPNLLPLPFLEQKSNGFCFFAESNKFLSDTRTAQANKALLEFDFDDLVFKDDCGWDITDNIWKKTIFLENEYTDLPSIRADFIVTFFQNSSHILSTIRC